MNTQLLLIDDSEHDWRLDPETRELGRRGIAQARQALHSVPRRSEHTTGTAVDESTPAEQSEDRPRRRPIAA